jgi:hypothetical protein
VLPLFYVGSGNGDVELFGSGNKIPDLQHWFKFYDFKFSYLTVLLYWVVIITTRIVYE